MRSRLFIPLLVLGFALSFMGFPSLENRFTTHAAPLTQVSGDNIRTIAIDPFSPSTLYVGTDRGIMKTIDGGLSWRSMNRGLVKNGVEDLMISSIVIDPHFPSTIYAISTAPYILPTGALYKSVDGGENWRLLRNDGMRSIAVNPTNSSILLAGGNGPDGGRSFKSVNGGSTWSIENAGWYDVFVDLLTYHPRTSSTVYASHVSRSTYNSIVKSTDGGGSWSDNLRWDDQITSSALHPEDPSVVYVTVSIRLGAGATDVLKSTDSGNSAVSIRGNLTGTHRLLSITSDHVRPATLDLATNKGLVKSTNDGLTWDDTSLTAIVNTLVIDQSAEATLYAGTTSGLFMSTDGGNTWVSLNGIASIQINGARIEGKKVIITGLGFDRESVVLIDGEKQKTAIDDQNPTTVILAKKAAKWIAPGQSVQIQVRDSEGLASASFLFTRPVQ